MKAVKCPICKGSGKALRKGCKPTKIIGHFTLLAAIMNEITCHGCGGKGWVEVSEGDCSPWYRICPII